MSATLDSSLFSSYYGDCAVLAAGGRTFPVEHRFLEDAYEATGYALDPDGPCAIRTDKAAAKAVLKAASQRDKSAVQVLLPCLGQRWRHVEHRCWMARLCNFSPPPSSPVFKVAWLL